MEPGHENESSNPSKIHTEFIVDEGDLVHQSKKSGSSSPSSSSSSGSSFDENFFFYDDIQSKEGIVSPPELDNDVQSASNGAEKVIPSISSPKPEASGLGSPGSTFPPEVSTSPSVVSGTSPETILNSGSVTQSPPVQVMGRTDSPGSYRIPSSVFARSSNATPMEWSVASNESLFSIHVGNNSFSADNMFLYRSGELGKSGDLVFPLTKSGELMQRTNSGELIKSGELINIQSNPSTGTNILVSNKKSSGLDGIGVTEAAAETMKEVLRVAAEDRNKEKTPAYGGRHSASISHHSDGSVTSNQSFAFPILIGEGGRSASVRPDPEQQPEQQQAQPEKHVATTPKAGGNKSWFHCFSCCPLC